MKVFHRIAALSLAFALIQGSVVWQSPLHAALPDTFASEALSQSTFWQKNPFTEGLAALWRRIIAQSERGESAITLRGWLTAVTIPVPEWVADAVTNNGLTLGGHFQWTGWKPFQMSRMRDFPGGQQPSSSGGWFANHRPRTPAQNRREDPRQDEALQYRRLSVHRYLNYIQAGEYIKAARLLETVLENDEEGRLLLAQTLEDSGDYRQAILVLSGQNENTLDGRLRSMWEARLLWSVLQEQVGNNLEALATLTGRSLPPQLDPIFQDSPYAVALFARQLGFNKMPRRGLSLLTTGDQIRRKFVGNPHIVMAASELYLMLGDIASARETLATILNRHPYDRDTSVLLLLEKIDRATTDRVSTKVPGDSPPSISQVLDEITEQDKINTDNQAHPHQSPYLRIVLKAILAVPHRHVLVVGSEYLYLGFALDRLGTDVVQLSGAHDEALVAYFRPGPLSSADSFLEAGTFDLIIMADPDEDETGPMDRALWVVHRLISNGGVAFLPNKPFKSNHSYTTPKAYVESALRTVLQPLPYKLRSPRSEPQVWWQYLLPSFTYSRAYRFLKIEGTEHASGPGMRSRSGSA